MEPVPVKILTSSSAIAFKGIHTAGALGNSEAVFSEYGHGSLDISTTFLLPKNDSVRRTFIYSD